MKYQLGPYRYRSKAEIKAYLKALLGSTSWGAVLSPDDSAMLMDLLKLHPDAASKIGCGVKRFIVAKPQAPTSKAFHVVRTDGSVEVFSYLACLDPRSDRTRATEAMRNELFPQIRREKTRIWQRHQDAQCRLWSAADNQWLDWDDCALDHYPVPFSAIRDRFLKERGLRLESIKVEYCEGNCLPMMADADLAVRWAVFHQRHATYRIISAKLNSKLGAHPRP